MINLDIALAEHGVGEGMPLADRNRRQIDTVGDIANRVDGRHRGLGIFVDRNAAVARIDGDAGLLEPKLATLGCRPIANITFSEAMLDPFDRCVVYSLPWRSIFSTVQPVRRVMPCFSISLRRWARTSSSKPRKMLSPR